MDDNRSTRSFDEPRRTDRPRSASFTRRIATPTITALAAFLALGNTQAVVAQAIGLGTALRQGGYLHEEESR
ncbi:MAG: hypothetical protein ABW187_02665, partial [Dokdonella sp.]